MSLRSGIAAVVMLVSALAVTPSHAMPPAASNLRSPQVPVQTNRLQSVLDGAGESIHVDTDQLKVQAFADFIGSDVPPVLQLEYIARGGGVDSIGAYDGALLDPERARVFPAEAGPGWFAVMAFRFNPTRMIVNCFDDQAHPLGPATFLVGNHYRFGIWMQSHSGTFYSEDARNPGGAPQLLFFAGTGINLGCYWIGIEAGPTGGGSTQDFADAVLFLQSGNVNPVLRSTWTAVKRRFR